MNFIIRISQFMMVFLLVGIGRQGLAQEAGSRKGAFYFSWGYNTEAYTGSTVKIDQPSLNNHYSFTGVHGHDHRGWDEGLFSKALTIPQYNYRLGFLFGDKHDLGVEINFDHTKFIFPDGPAHVQGVLHGRNVDTTVNFRAPDFFYYLNNGANFLLFNIVKRWHWKETRNGAVRLDGLGKFGIGPVVPHVDNRFFGDPPNNPHFQLGGWNTGVEGALRATFFRHVYLELAGKLDYARYSNLEIYMGTAKQAFGTAEVILNLGVAFPAGKR